MEFRTQITGIPNTNQIDYQSNILLFGSCFTENISKKLTYFKFNTQSNPFGILFNPKALETIITNSIHQKVYTENDVFFSNERWHSFDAHSDLSSVDLRQLLSTLNHQIKTTKIALEKASHLIITLGTAWVYRYIAKDQIVGNCHKIPQKQFIKELLTVDEISASLHAITSLTKDINPNIEIIFTVSPIRHLKDGFVENSRSKAHLIAGIHSLISEKNNIHYFPSFEIMMDDLRDYRFYTSDMLHPSNTAIQYIWEQFSHVWIHPKTASIQKEVATIQKGLNHRPFNPDSKQHQQFTTSLEQKISALKSRYNIKF